MLPLRVYVAADCVVSDIAYHLVATIQKLRPYYPIEIIDISTDTVQRPAYVFGTPTYCLGEQIVSLGNPALPTLLAMLDAQQEKGQNGQRDG